MRDGWIETTLGDVARVNSGFAFSTKSWRDTGIPVIKINNVRNGHVSLVNCSFVSDPLPEGASRFLLKKGDLLITLTGEIGAVGFVTQSQPMYLNQRVGRIDLRDNKNVLLDFLGLFLTLPEVRAEMWSHGKGNAQLNISPASIHSLKINLPPITEQKRIVDLISSVDFYIESLEQQLGSVRSASNAHLEKIVSAFSDDWREVTLGEVLEISRGGSPRPIQEYLTNSEDGINWVKIADATRSEKYIYSTLQKIKREGISRSREVFAGDFILSNSMSFGRPYIMRTDGCIHDVWLLLSKVSSNFDEDFLYNLLNSD